MKLQNREIFKLHAEFCKTLAHPTRLMILALLAKKELSVGEISETVGHSMANISQHLRSLKNQHIVKSRKDGQTVYYQLSDVRLVDACQLIREVLLDELKQRGMIARDFKAENVVVED